VRLMICCCQRGISSIVQRAASAIGPSIAYVGHYPRGNGHRAKMSVF
jgi:hypothetical protein